MANAGAPPRAASRADLAALWIAVVLGASIPVSTALDGVLVVAFLVCWAVGGRFREKFALIRSNPLALAAGAFFLLHVAGSAYSIGAPREILHAVSKAFTVVLVPLLVGLAPDELWVRRALHAFLAALGVTLLLSYLIWAGAVPVGVFKGVPADPAVFKLKITQSVLMSYGAFVLALAARSAKSARVRWLLIGAAALAACNVLFMVLSRTGQVVLLALLFYLFVSTWRWRGVLITAAVGTGLGVAAVLVPANALYQRALVTMSELRDWQAGKPPTQLANMRLESWSNSVQIIKEHPLVGVGTGGFAAAYAAQVAGTGMRSAPQPENQYLYIAVELGAVGVLALLALFAAQWRLAVRLATRMDTDLARGLVILMAVGCLFNSFLHDHAESLFYVWLSGLLYSGLRATTR